MVEKAYINGKDFSEMIKSGTANLKKHIKEINDLNVFPIPDGDTGDNMFSTMVGGVNSIGDGDDDIGITASAISNGMVYGARGNSGVILSQFFSGLTNAFKGFSEVDSQLLKNSLMEGTKKAYKAVMSPTEGTILTVMRQGAEVAELKEQATPLSVLECFLNEAKIALEETPEKLYVLKKAGVVDSGGAGFVYIVEGMINALKGEAFTDDISAREKSNTVNYNLFNENSVLEFGYCVEILVRLQNAKTDINNFDEKEFSEALKEFGNSVVAFKDGSLLKVHIHTFLPHKILELSQNFGEFLEVKIENMSLQHNNTIAEDNASTNNNNNQSSKIDNKKNFGIVAVCAGDGIKNMFLERGVDIVIDGGQTMNPSTEDFISAFEKINADTIFVFPNNSNIILTAKLASSLYKEAKVEVIESHTIGEGYSALAMYDTTLSDIEEQKENFALAMDNVITCCVSSCTKETDDVKIGDYIGFVDKEIIAINKSREAVAVESIEKIDLSLKEICIIIYGKNANENEALDIKYQLLKKYSSTEFFLINGMQDIYDYIFIVE